MFLLFDWNGSCKDKASVDQSFINIKQIQVNYNFAQYWLSSNEESLSTEEEFGKTGERAQVTFLPVQLCSLRCHPHLTLEQMTTSQTFYMSTYYVPGGLCASL